MKNIKFLTLNIQHGKGIDGVVDLERQAKDIKAFNPDIVVLQEVDVFINRSNKENQMQRMKILLDMPYSVMGVNINYKDGYFGNLILSKFPIIDSMNYILPKCAKPTEQRGLLLVTMNINDEKVDIFTTHFSTNKEDRLLSSRRLVEIIQTYYNKHKTILAGDFNTGMVPLEERGYDHIPEGNYEELELIKEEFLIVESKRNTYPSDNPIAEIDYIFHSKNIKLLNNSIVETKNSDHFGVFAEFEL